MKTYNVKNVKNVNYDIMDFSEKLQDPDFRLRKLKEKITSSMYCLIKINKSRVSIVNNNFKNNDGTLVFVQETSHQKIQPLNPISKSKTLRVADNIKPLGLSNIASSIKKKLIARTQFGIQTGRLGRSLARNKNT